MNNTIAKKRGYQKYSFSAEYFKNENKGRKFVTGWYKTLKVTKTFVGNDRIF